MTFLRDRLRGEALIPPLSGAHAIVVMRERTPITAGLLRRLPQLRLIVTTGPRNAAADVAACRAVGVTACGTRPGGPSAAELTWGLILSAARSLPKVVQEVRDGYWPANLGRELSGERLGIVGLGRIGSIVARHGQAFGIDVAAWSPDLDAARCAAAGVAFVSREELFASSDFVTVHLALAPSTRELIGSPEITLMKETAWLINTSRSAIIDSSSLIAACRLGKIAGAVVDVFDAEPLPEVHPLRDMPNIIATPHIGYVTRQTFATLFADTVDDIHAFSKGEPLRLLTP